MEPTQPDLLDLYARSSAWANEKVAGAADQLAARTPCEGWDVRTLLDHMLDTERYFASSARGEEASLPTPEPPRMVGDDPVADLRRSRADVLAAFAEDGVVEKTGPALGIAFSERALHGWDLARATGQDAQMPDDLAEAAYGMIHGRFTDEQRKGVFGPEIPVGPDASAQDRLLAYTGRDPR
jgi:uncharacterized protein (TIGR03086 family)